MKKLFSLLLSAALLSGLLVTGASAATLQSNQAVYQLSQDPLGTEPFSYSATETHSATLVPVGTAIQSGGDGLLLVEVFLYHEAEKHWNLDSMLSGQSQLTIRDGDHIYHISTMDPSSSEPNAVLDRGIWVKGQSTGEVQPVTVTGEPVDDWAANLVNEAIAKDLFPAHLKGQDLREPITRTQFAALSVRLYEAMSGQTIPAFTGTNPFTDTTDPEVLKAYSMGFTSGVSSTAFGAGTQLNREQAATLIAANGGLGAGFPPCAGLFIVLGFPTVAGIVEEGALYIALLVTGLYQVAWRLVYIHYVVRKNHIQPTLVGEQEPISEVFRKHGICMTLFLGAVIPVLLTMGPLNKALAGRSEAWEGAMDSVNLLVWLPTLMICIILLLDGRNIVKKFSSWEDFVKKFIPHIANTGGLLFFIFAVSNIITKLGLGDDVVSVLDKMNLSPIVTLIVVYVLVAVVAGPLSSTATLTAVGVVGVGFDPLTTAAALLMISSTEGASPPASGALFVACGLTECDPPKIYMPLINWFVAPIVVMGCLVATGILPVP